MEFAMAAATLARQAGLLQYTDEFVRRPEVQALMRRVRIETNEDYDPDLPGASRFDQVRLALKSGERVASEKVRRARGHGELPLAASEVFEKFRSCLEAGGSRIAPAILFDRLQRLETISARDLTAVA
jgi:2-methylcitrate dehydratase PrpD